MFSVMDSHRALNGIPHIRKLPDEHTQENHQAADPWDNRGEMEEGERVWWPLGTGVGNSLCSDSELGFTFKLITVQTHILL